MKKTISWGNLPINESIKQINFDSKFSWTKITKLLTYGKGRATVMFAKIIIYQPRYPR